MLAVIFLILFLKWLPLMYFELSQHKYRYKFNKEGGNEMYKYFGVVLVSIFAFFFSFTNVNAAEKSHMRESVYNQDIRKATTSENLTNADIAWHAVNTYGWDCEEVVSRSPSKGEFYIVECSNGSKLRVYPRTARHPKITNINGGYK